jgi:hypothetical protein
VTTRNSSSHHYILFFTSETKIYHISGAVWQSIIQQKWCCSVYFKSLAVFWRFSRRWPSKQSTYRDRVGERLRSIGGSPASPRDAKLTPVIHLCGALEISRLFGMDDELKVAGDKEQREARSSAALRCQYVRQTALVKRAAFYSRRRRVCASLSRICIFANR